jgi:hypothetical protein
LKKSNIFNATQIEAFVTNKVLRKVPPFSPPIYQTSPHFRGYETNCGVVGNNINRSVIERLMYNKLKILGHSLIVFGVQ